MLLQVQRRRDLLQTADGKLLSAESIEASCGSWVNDGRIETNGSLELILTGTYRGDCEGTFTLASAL